MKRILFLLPAFALLGGCAELSSLGVTPGQILQGGISVARQVDCLVANNATGAIVRADTALACQLLGGTVTVR